MANPRNVVFDALLKLERNKSYSNITLDAALSEYRFDSRDKAFISALFYGVIERQITLDFQLSGHLSKPLKKLKPEVLVILRMGAYQILFMEKVPSSAAVNESVKIAKSKGCSFASGLINAVLRQIDKNGLILPQEDTAEYLSVKYSCPLWLIEKWTGEYGKENCIGILENTLGNPGIYIRVNTLKTTARELIGIFSKEGVIAEECYLPDALKIKLGGNDIESLDSYRKGLFHVQDIASQLCALALDATEGDTVFDMCSAPGGKAFTLAEAMNNTGKLYAFDIHKHRVELIMRGAERLGITTIRGKTGDATEFDASLGLADKILCDVPCSGLGIIRRKPEIKYKSPDELEALPEIQYKILSNAARYLKSGGRLVYSTCALSKAENEDVCDRFLAENSDFYPAEAYRTLMPHTDGCDGFFIGILHKK